MCARAAHGPRRPFSRAGRCYPIGRRLLHRYGSTIYPRKRPRACNRVSKSLERADGLINIACGTYKMHLPIRHVIHAEAYRQSIRALGSKARL